jgi:hypothetical protein
MTKEDVRLVISSATGKNVYIEAMISRTVARRIEKLLEENEVVITAPYSDSRKHPSEHA